MINVIFLILVLTMLAGNCLAQSPVDWPLQGININLDGSRITTKDMDSIYESGMSLVIFNLKPWHYAKYRSVSKHTAFTAVMKEAEDLSMYAKSLGIVSIIEYSQFPLYEKKFGIRSHEFWGDPKYIDEMYSVTATLAKRFADNDAILGYKIMDEPVENNSIGRPSVPDDWYEIQSKIVAEVRQVDLNKYVVVTSGPGGLGKKYSNWVPFDDQKIIYGAHFFSPHFYTHQGIGKLSIGVKYPSDKMGRQYLESLMSPIIQFKRKYDVPILIGSFGVSVRADGELEYLKDIIDIFNHNDFAWAYWQYNGFKLWNLGVEVDSKGIIQKLGVNSKRWKIVRHMVNNE